jgi:prevent-host-death family protein
MTNYIVMKRANVHDAKTHFSRYLDEVAAGETILICKHNQPVAELRPIPSRATSPRPWGIDHGVLEVPADFNAPLPDDILAEWEE